MADWVHSTFDHMGPGSPRVALGEHPVPFRKRPAVRASQAATYSGSALGLLQALSAALLGQLGVPDLMSYVREEQRRNWAFQGRAKARLGAHIRLDLRHHNIHHSSRRCHNILHHTRRSHKLRLGAAAEPVVDTALAVVLDECLRSLGAVGEVFLGHKVRCLRAAADVPCQVVHPSARAWSWSWRGAQILALHSRHILPDLARGLDVVLESLEAGNSAKDPEGLAENPWMVWVRSRPPRGLGLGLCLLVFYYQYPGCPSSQGCFVPHRNLSSVVCLGMSGRDYHRILARLEIFETG